MLSSKTLSLKVHGGSWTQNKMLHRVLMVKQVSGDGFLVIAGHTSLWIHPDSEGHLEKEEKTQLDSSFTKHAAMPVGHWRFSRTWGPVVSTYPRLTVAGKQLFWYSCCGLAAVFS